MNVHAFLRGQTEVISVEFAGLNLKFKPNDRGHVVCEVPDDVAPALIEAAGDAFREYQGDAVVIAQAPAAAPAKPAATRAKKAEAEKPATEPTDPSGNADGASDAASFVITPSDGPAVDLGPMSDAELRAFAVEQGLAKPHHTKTGDKLRQLIIDQLKAG